MINFQKVFIKFNVLQFICILSAALQGQIQAGAFFWDGQNPRAGLHFGPEHLDAASIDLNLIQPNYILTSLDPEQPTTARMALITQNPTNGQWIVQYYSIESLRGKSYATLENAQRFTLAHLQSGFNPAQQAQQPQTIPSAGKPQKTVFPSEAPGAWRQVRSRRR